MRLALAAAAVLLLAGCASPTDDDGPGGGDGPAGSGGPSGGPLNVTVSAWRDDMPGPGPAQHPTRVFVRLQGEGHAQATVGDITVRPPGGEPWTGAMARRWSEPGLTDWHSGDGPEWPPGTVLRVSFAYHDTAQRLWTGNVTLQSAV